MARRAAVTRRRLARTLRWIDANVLRHPMWGAILSGAILLALTYAIRR
jgi:hypothetical protein